jgi:Mrp family chromosome partitioning ATPase
MFVSLSGGEGKTYLIEQLAKLARESGLKVLLVDANFGAPALHLAFGKSPSAGMAEILSGAVEARAVIVTLDGGLGLITAGLKRPTAQSKWVVEKVQQELLQLKAGYDLVLIDTAALRVDSSVTRLIPLATDIVCVFDATKSCRSDADVIRQRLGNAASKMKYLFNKKMHAGDHLFEAGTNGHSNGNGHAPGNGHSAGRLTSKPGLSHA